MFFGEGTYKNHSLMCLALSYLAITIYTAPPNGVDVICHVKTIRLESHLLGSIASVSSNKPNETCQKIEFNLEHTVDPTTFSQGPPSPLPPPSGADKHQAGGIDKVAQVEDEVDASKHSHRHALVPWAEPASTATGVGPLLGAALLGVKVEDGPNDGGRQVEDDGQHGVRRQEAGKGEGQTTGALAHAEHDDGGRQDEADAVDGHAVLQRLMAVVQHRVADKDEDDAGDEGLTHLEQARRRGHVAGHLARSCLADAHLANVGHGGQAGEDGGDHTIVVDLVPSGNALDVGEGEDNGGGQAEQGGVAGEGYGEVLPGDGSSGLEAKQFHQEDEQGTGKAKGPAEDAPVAGALPQEAPVHGQREGHAGEDHGGQPRPEERAGLDDDGHDGRCRG